MTTLCATPDDQESKRHEIAATIRRLEAEIQRLVEALATGLDSSHSLKTALIERKEQLQHVKTRAAALQAPASIRSRSNAIY